MAPKKKSSGGAEPTNASLGTEVLQLRLGREQARGSEELQVSLVWNDIADLDLHVVTPRKEEVRDRRSNSDLSIRAARCSANVPRSILRSSRSTLATRSRAAAAGWTWT
jgi:hypothetical protein